MDIAPHGARVSQGPFKRFTAIVGPNGAGKSNLMDAISFVLGVRTMQLRGQQLRDLIFRKEGEETVERDAYVKLSFAKASAEEEEEGEGEEEDDEAAEILTFARKISSSGASSYVLNGRTVTWERYSKALAEIGVNVTSRKFLVFQGDVESIAGMAPRELTTYFEKVSGSDELKDAYGSAEASKNQSEDDYFRYYRSGWPSVVGAAPAPSQSSQQQPPQGRLYIRHPGRHVAYPAALRLLDLRYGFPGLGHLFPACARRDAEQTC